MDADVIVVGAGPAGLMLAAELCLGGVRPLVLERATHLGATPNANGLGGQVMDLLRHRGLLDRFAAAASDASPPPIYPFGGVRLDLTGLDDPPLRGMQLEHPSVDRLLDERAVELGADVRRGHRVVGVAQDDDGVRVDVQGPAGASSLRGRYLVGCDGARSRIRDLAGVAFPGTTYPEVHRLAELTVPPSVTVLENGDLDVEGRGTVAAGFTRTDGGTFALGSLSPGILMILTVEDEPDDGDDRAPAMTLDELRGSIRRVLGVDLPLGDPRRLSRYRHEARQADRYREGRTLLAGDAAHVLPATGMARSVGMLDAANLGWKLAAEVRGDAPAGLLDTYHQERHVAGARALLQTQAQVALRRGHDEAADALREVLQELLTDEQPRRRLAALVAGADVRYPLAGPGHHPSAGGFVPDAVVADDPRVADALRAARPVLAVVAERSGLREAARGWEDRVAIVTAASAGRPADAVLVRPDAHVAWAAAVGESTTTAVPALREALARWFGPPQRAGAA